MSQSQSIFTLYIPVLRTGFRKIRPSSYQILISLHACVYIHARVQELTNKKVFKAEPVAIQDEVPQGVQWEACGRECRQLVQSSVQVAQPGTGLQP